MSGLLGLPYGTTFATDVPGVQPAPAPSPFVWGEGGARLTPDQIVLQQKLAASKMQGDYTPVANVWQGLGRVTDNITGALQWRDAKKASAANAANDQSVAQLLMRGQTGGSGAAAGNFSAVAAALANPYLSDSTHHLAGKVFDAQNRKPAEPHYWETNNGSLGMIGADGQPHIAYQDPTPKINWITADNADHTKQIIPMGPNGPLTAGAHSNVAPLPPVGTIEDGHRFVGGDPSVESSWVPVAAAGGAAPSGTATFR